MSFYLLPRAPLYIYKNIQYSETSEPPTNVISQSLCHYLYNIKRKITDREKQWDVFKKYTNPYEYIHTVVPLKKKSVSKHKPLSRSYFKMIEIINTFSILSVGPSIHFITPTHANTTPHTPPIHTFHLAEGPGGFIEAIVRMRNCKEDKYIGMTLLDTENDYNIPAWKKSEMFLKSNPNVMLENGVDNTGNILTLENFNHVVKKYHSKMDIITGDGGFDFSMDFNQQEILIGRLLFAQIAYALCLQKRGGKFILKIFDSFMQHTLDLIYILTCFYERVYIMKPHTSRYANSEKYIVCIGFLHGNHTEFYPFLNECFKKMVMNTDAYPLRFLNLTIPQLFIKKIEEYNAIFGQKQIQNIYYTLSLIENKIKHDKIEHLIKTNIQKSMNWCAKYNIPHHILNTPTNIFTGNSSSVAVEEDK
jgi:23S rRNA U2552 (ribose-2'-O)-methylase RlmE/FtsJ